MDKRKKRRDQSEIQERIEKEVKLQATIFIPKNINLKKKDIT